MSSLQFLLGFALNLGVALLIIRKKSITYEKIDLIKPEHRDQLLADLRERTGLSVTDCEVKRIDFLHDVAELQVHYE